MGLMNPGRSHPHCAPSLEAFTDRRESICVIGLGYVGLPLAVAFASRFRVFGFDINPVRVRELQDGHDRTLELTEDELRRYPIEFTTDGDTRSLSVGRAIQGAVRPIAGARAGEEVSIVNTEYWMGSEVIVAEAVRGRVRAFGRVWNFEGRSAEICNIKWEG